MKKWQLELLVFLVIFFPFWLLTGIGGFIGGVIIALPSSLIGGYIWNNHYAKYKCEACDFTSATKDDMKSHIKKKHKNTKVKYSEYIKK